MQRIHPLTIGAVTTRTNLVLAPMSGVTDCAFRNVVLACSGPAVGLVVSEFVAAEGLTRANERTLSMLRYKECERPVSIQIFGADVDRMVRSAKMVEDCGADIVDVNCGCPAPKVVRRGGGAELMRQPARLAAIVRGIRAAVKIPVTVKIRAGWDDDSRNALDVARMVEGEGAALLAVHGRTRRQLYSGRADWDLVGRIREELSIPVLGSGDVTRPEHALERLGDRLADGVLVGRGAIDDPWIFAKTRAADAGEAAPEVTAEDRVAALRLFVAELEQTGRPVRAYLGRVRGLACRMVKGMAGGAAARQAIGASDSPERVLELFAEFVLRGRSGLEQVAAVA